jgi:Tol biopolymer transport system component
MAYSNQVDGHAYLFDPNKPWREQTPQALPPLGDEQQPLDAAIWSPDGRWLAVWLSPGIAVYSLETRQYRILTDFGAVSTWLPDSRRLLFRDYPGVIRVVNIQSGESHEVLALSPDHISWPALSNDGRWLYFTRTTLESDIWLLTLNEEP